MNKNYSIITIIVLLFLFEMSLQQAVQINGGVCVCQVISEGKYQWWTMNGWNQGTCNSYVNANNGRTMLMGSWRLVTCEWKGGKYDRPVYGFKSVKNGKWCSADNYG
jgi:hypothetical protein